METRKSFLRKTGIASAGFSLLADPFIKAIASVANVSHQKIISQFSYTCEIMRPGDMLYLRYYFVNLEPSHCRSFLEKTNARQDAYIIVRLPPQHIAEEVHDWLVIPAQTNIPTTPEEVFSNSFLSGYSYLTFKLKDKQSKIKLTDEALLNWSQFDLMTLDDLKKYPQDIPVKLVTNSNYPLAAENMPFEFCIAILNGINIPVTVFEAPYKMILSPIAPYMRPARYASYGYGFAGDNQENKYWPNKYWNRELKLVPHLSELWNNDLVFQVIRTDGSIKNIPPNFKIIGYEELTPEEINAIPPGEVPADYDCNGTLLLPDPINRDRSNLAQLTNIPEFNRDVVSDYYKISPLGVSTFLQYSNDDEKTWVLTGWKQEIELGRDNYVELAEKAIDMRSTLKLTLLRIAERRVEQGVSFLVYRLYFKYVETFKSFADPVLFQGHLIKSIKPKKVGSYYGADNMISVEHGYFPCEESLDPLLQTRIVMPYICTDANGQEFDLNIDVFIFPKWATASSPAARCTQRNQPGVLNFVEANVNDTLKALHKFIAASYNDFAIKLPNTKIAYVPNIPQNTSDPSNQVVNTSLYTTGLQFYTVYNGAYETDYPLVGRLKYALAYIPQLDGVESTPKARPVTFAKTFALNGFDKQLNKTQVFLQTLGDTIYTEALQATDEEGLVTAISNQAAPIKNIFSENYKTIGALVNPDVVISHLSILKQGITLSDDLNQRVNDIQNLRPADILRGLNTEIMGGIDLKQILSEFIPIEDSPIFQIIDGAIDGFEQYKNQYDKIQQLVKSLPQQISQLEDSLKSAAISEFKKYMDDFIEKSQLLQNIEIYASTLVTDSLSIEKVLFQNFNDLITAGKNLTPEAAAVKTLLTDLSNVLNSDKTIQDSYLSIIAVKQIQDLIVEIATVSAKTMENKMGAVVSAQTIGTAKDNALADSTNILELETLIKKYTVDPTAGLPSVYSTITAGYNQVAGIISVALNSAAGVIGNKVELMSAIAQQMINNFTYQVPGISFPKALLDYPPTGAATKLGDLLSTLSSIPGKSISISDDVSGWSDFLTANPNLLPASMQNVYQTFTASYKDTIAQSTQYMAYTQDAIKTEINYSYTQISSAIVDKVNALNAGKGQYLLNLKRFQNIFTQYQQIYNSTQTKIQHYSEIYQYVVDPTQYQAEVNKLQANVAPLLNTLANHSLSQFKNDFKNLYTAVNSQFSSEEGAIMNNLNQKINSIDPLNAVLFFNSMQAYAPDIATAIESLEATADAAYQTFDAERQQIINQINAKKQQLLDAQSQLTNFFTGKVTELENNLATAKQQLAAAYNEGMADVSALVAAVTEAQRLVDLVKSVSQKQVTYTWQTQEFQDKDFDIVDFRVCRQVPTNLAVNFASLIKFKPGFPPVIDSVSYQVSTVLSNFSVGFFKIIILDFDHVSFQGGSNIPAKFDVAIRGVNFDGPLNFVKVFQDYLQSVDKNLRFDISSFGATLGYDIELPSITGGAFNFTNAKLALSLNLPFVAGVPMRFTFGLNTPQDEFLLTASIYGGRGCFQIGVEPKNGVVLILLVLEFGVVVYINLGIADGIAYIFAGIYIRKEYNVVTIKGYITCGGALNILDLITASVTFYLGLEGNGNYLEGYCSLTIELDICAFLSFSVSMSMYKRLYGSSDNSSTSNQDKSLSLDSRLMTAFGTSPPPPPHAIKNDLTPNTERLNKSDVEELLNSYFN